MATVTIDVCRFVSPSGTLWTRCVPTSAVRGPGFLTETARSDPCSKGVPCRRSQPSTALWSCSANLLASSPPSPGRISMLYMTLAFLSGVYACWCLQSESNRRPSLLHSDALPTELHRHDADVPTPSGTSLGGYLASHLRRLQGDDLAEASGELVFCAEGGGRTRTSAKAHRNLNPACLPIPPLQQSCFVVSAERGGRTLTSLRTPGLESGVSSNSTSPALFTTRFAAPSRAPDDRSQPTESYSAT